MKWRHPTATPTYYCWDAMHIRCSNPDHPGYENYGGRGITVCERWNSYDLFVEDMGFKPEGMELDRIDNNGNYEPTNCKWSTHKAQARNRRSCHMLTLNDRTMCVAEWSEELGIGASTIRARLRRGWSDKDALKL